MQKVTKLTAEQESLLPAWADKWTSIGLSCEPLNYDAAVDAAKRAYAAASLPAPERFVVCDGPFSGAIVAAILMTGIPAGVGASVRDSVLDSVWDSVQASVWDSVRANVWDSVQASVRDSVGASVRDSVRANVWDSVRDSVGASVRDSVRAGVWDSVGASVRDSVRAGLRDSVYGAHDAHWLGFYDFFLSNCGLAEQVAPLQPLIDLASHCGWWSPYANVCILQHRHCELHRDPEGRLHNANGPAVLYRDGWGVWAWHGVHIPIEKAWIIDDPNRIDVAAIDGERNAEIRRVMLELFGHDRYIVESGMKPVQTDTYGELFRREIADDEPLCMVRVVNSTPESDGELKKYMLRVPPTMQTAHQAIAWSFDMSAAEYAPMAES